MFGTKLPKGPIQLLWEIAMWNQLRKLRRVHSGIGYISVNIRTTEYINYDTLKHYAWVPFVPFEMGASGLRPLAFR